jgi:hypothetical protein
MYINKMDELIDKIIDDFYNTIIKNKDFLKITKETNFVKYQGKLNKILIDYDKHIDRNEIGKIIKNPNSVAVVVDILRKYIGYYVFLYIGFLYKDKKDTYINNIIEFTKNQHNFEYRIANFFNSESNSKIIRLNMIIRNIVTLVNADKVKLKILAKKYEYKKAINILNEFGNNFVIKNFKLDNLGGNIYNQGHNIIKSIIVNEIYIKEEKKNIYDILEESEKEKGEYIYIDIVIPKASYIDVSAIESVLDKNDIDNGLVYEIYEMISKYEDINKVVALSHNDKILELINKKIIIPISEDFMLYHKGTERYDKYVAIEPGKKPKKEETKIRYIVSKIDNASELYSEASKKNENIAKKIEKLYYLPMNGRKVVLVNDTEEIRIINKIHNLGRKSIENNEYYNDLLNYRLYTYINYKDFKKYGFSITIDKISDMVRSIFLDSANVNNFIETRIGCKQSVNIVGLIVPTNIVPIQCLKIKNLNNIRKLKFEKTHSNGYTGTVRFLKHILFKKKKHKTSMYWQFDLEKDKVKIDQYEQLAKMTQDQHIKYEYDK